MVFKKLVVYNVLQRHKLRLIGSLAFELKVAGLVADGGVSSLLLLLVFFLLFRLLLGGLLIDGFVGNLLNLGRNLGRNLGGVLWLAWVKVDLTRWLASLGWFGLPFLGW